MPSAPYDAELFVQSLANGEVATTSYAQAFNQPSFGPVTPRATTHGAAMP